MLRSPDGTALLASMDIGHMISLKLTDGRNLESTCEINSHMSGFNDFDWYPWMNSSLVGSDIFLTSSKDIPIQLWSSSEGKVICTWTAKDHLDQVATCLSVSFSPDGQKVFAGGQDKIWIFDTNRPGTTSICDFQTIASKKSKCGQKGLISCMNFRFDDTGVFAAGSFKGSVGVYDSRTLSDRNSSAFCLFDAHKNGVSQVKFLNDGWSIITAGRREGTLKKWDLRMMQEVKATISPVSEYIIKDPIRTNQRIYFDISNDGKLFTGGKNGFFEFETSTGEILNVKNTGDIVSSVSINKEKILAFSAGCRRFDMDDSDSDEIGASRIIQNSIGVVHIT